MLSRYHRIKAVASKRIDALQAKRDKRNTADRAMSCAFVKEPDAETFNLPVVPLSAHPHFVTRQKGLAAIESALNRFDARSHTTFTKMIRLRSRRLERALVE